MKIKFYKSLILLILVFVVYSSSVYAQENKETMYTVEVKYSDAETKFGEVLVRAGFIPNQKEVDAGEIYFTVKLISFTKKLLEETSFNIETLLLVTDQLAEPDQETGPASIEQKQLDYIIYFPYHKDGEMLELYDSANKLIDSRNIAPFADVCGDGICQSHENYTYCASDCKDDAKDDFCNKEKMESDPDCEIFLQAKKLNEENKTKTAEPAVSAKAPAKSTGILMIIVSVALLIITIIIIVVAIKFSRKRG
jgi:hypothetical protein